MNHFLHLLCIASMTLISAAVVRADQGELDKEKNVTNQANRVADLPQTLVIRVNQQTQAVEVAHVQTVVSDPATTSPAQLAALPFTAVNTNQTYSQKTFNDGVAELDRDNSRESWYFTWGYRYPRAYPAAYYPLAYPTSAYGYYPTYTYGGYNYAYYPYATYAAPAYAYYPAYNYYYYTPYIYSHWRR